jgi:folate-dependent phosphoribosylglycinamide formyltransferase PurN
MTYPAIVVAVSGGGSNLQALIDAIAEGRMQARNCLGRQ